MVKVKSFPLSPFLIVVSILIFTPYVYADPPIPPSFLTAISDQDEKVPLFWFRPNPNSSELAYDDGSMHYHKYVSTEWHHNCLAVKMTSPEVLFYLLKSKVFISYDSDSIDPNYDFEAPFFITVNQDSGGIPKNTFLDSVSAQATGEDGVGIGGGWVEVEHNLLMNDSVDFWIVFHWMEETPLSPLVGVDRFSNVGNSFWGTRKSAHFEWHFNDYNIMIRAVIVTNGDDSCVVDSFRIYRSDTSFSISDTNLIGSVSSDQFQYVDTNVNNAQTYFYKVTSCSSENESDASNEASATPKKRAVLTLDQSSFEINLCSPDTAFEDLTLTNSGGLLLEFKIEIDMEKQSWMGGSDKFGYTWTDKNLQGGSDYSWVDIKDFGEEIGESGDNDENYGFFSLGFPFRFYGNFFDSLRISSNGWISFTDTMDSIPACYVNKPLPWIWGPYNLIAPFWDDLIFSDNSKIYFYSNNLDSAIISFINLDHWGDGGPYTFQTILNRNGEILFQYDRLGDPDTSATVGIQNKNGTTGLEVIWNEEYLEDSLWVKIRPGWVSVNSMWGTIESGESKTLNLTFDRLSYPQGIYHANLIINSRDLNHELDTIEIPLTLCIDTTTSVDFEEDQKPVTFALFQNYPNPFNPATSVQYAVGGRQTKAADGGLVLSEVEGRRTADGSFPHITAENCR
ncbi:MAG: hypothetical protein AMJ89_01565 [candidate division Zixibacteria bacterium SM23_73]|nr:MAG: hypothetical protein AMJ89_01565 [candidate division Zixibacteria bacterium SM23_73]